MAIIKIPKLFHPDFAVPNQKPKSPVVVDYAAPASQGLRVVELFGQRLDTLYPLQVFDGKISRGNLVSDGTTTAGAVLPKMFEREYPGTGDFTLYLDAILPTVPAGNVTRELFQDYESGARPTNHMGRISLKANGGGTLWSMRGDGIFSSITDTSFNRSPGDRFRILVLRRNGVVFGYINGVLSSSGANTEDFFNRKGYVDNCHFGTGHTSRTSAEAEYISFAFWRQALSTPPEQFDINQLLKPATSQVYFTASGVGAQDISPTGIASAEAFGTPVITTGAVDIAPTGIGSAEAFGTAAITTTVDVAPTGIASEEAFGSPTISAGAVDIAPTSIASAEVFGTAVLTTGSVDVSPSGIASGESFGSPTITTGALNVSPDSITSGEAFGTVTITTGAVDVSPTGIGSAESFGTVVVSQGLVISPTGIASAESFGTPVVSTGAVDVSPTGIASSEAFGTPTVAVDAQVVSPNGIASVEAFGTPALTTGAVSISPTGISSEESFGTVTVAIPGAKTIQIDGQDSLIINQNLGSTTLYFNGKDYFSI